MAKQWSQEEITLGTIIYPLYYNLVTINHAHHVLLLCTRNIVILLNGFLRVNFIADHGMAQPRPFPYEVSSRHIVVVLYMVRGVTGDDTK